MPIMTSPDRSSAGPAPVSLWLVGAVVLAVLAVLAAVGAVIIARSGADGPVAGGVPVEATPGQSVTAPVAQGLPEPPEGGPEAPTGRVAYLTADGQVLVGIGAVAPQQVATDAALAENGLGAVAIAPTGDLVAYVRQDGSLVVVSVAGGEPTVLATDASLDAIGDGSALGWDATGGQIAYIARGTADMARPRPESPPPLSGEGVFRVPLPEGVLGDVVNVVDRTGAPIVTIGDPSTRSMVGVATSESDDLMILESVLPDTGRPFTLSLASSGSPEELPTLLSADEPSFSPDGNFVVAVGPDKGRQELIRIATDALARTTLVSADRICGPSVSPDSSRIAYGTGEDCSRLHLVSSNGGQPVDVTPKDRPGGTVYVSGSFDWTPEGRFLALADCRERAGGVRCGGPTSFFDPDRAELVPGPVATTVAPVRQTLLQELRLDLVMDGPIRYEGEFAVSAETQGEITELDEDTGVVDIELTDGDREMRLELQVQEGADFATGRMTITDPERGIDRTLLVLGEPSVIGIRVVALSGMWMTTDELPFAAGEFRLAVRRR
jgi:hypothetical protein